MNTAPPQDSPDNGHTGSIADSAPGDSIASPSNVPPPSVNGNGAVAIIGARKIRRILGSAARKVGLRGGSRERIEDLILAEPQPIVPYLPPKPPWYPEGDIPQADMIDRVPFLVEDRDWRKEFTDHLTGFGLEIGPLHRPMTRHEGMLIDYLDRHTVAELRATYPELNDLPLVEPQIIDDAETLATVGDGRYDFVIAAHVIEHMRNPIGAIEQWARVLKPGGMIYLVVPDKRATFDHRRVRTRLEHLVLDYRRPSQERDFDHYLEYSSLVDRKRGEEAFKGAEKLAGEGYPIHYHTFLPEDVVRLLGWISNNIRRVELILGPCAANWSDEFHLLVRVP